MMILRERNDVVGNVVGILTVGSYDVMVGTLDFESRDLSSSLGRTSESSNVAANLRKKLC